MKQPIVNFIGGDFNMSAFSTGGDVLSDTEFSAPCKSFLWGLGALENPDRERAGFLIMPERPCEWRVDTHGCYTYDNATLGFGPRDHFAHLLVFLHLRTTNLPGSDSIMRREHAQQRRIERRHENTSVCGDDVLDRDVAHQSHVSAHLFPSSSITCESPGASCFAPH